jgi:hypothetical protein
MQLKFNSFNFIITLYFYVCYVLHIYLTLVKQSHNTPMEAQGERMYSSYSLTNSAIDGGEWSASRPGRALPPEEGSPVLIVQEAGWAPDTVWTQRLEENSFRLCQGSNSNRLFLS